MVPKKAKSKRLTLSKKYKIERKVREHTRKMRKEAKKNPNAHRGRVDPVPDSWGIKHKIAEDYQELRDYEKQQQQRRQEELKKRREATDLDDIAKQNELALLVAQTTQRQEEYDESDSDDEHSDMEDAVDGSSKSETQQFMKDLKKVVQMSDVVLQILDARDPMGTRSPVVENMVKNSRKKLLLVLNKIDLVPVSVALGWLSYLRKSFPTVAFKSSTQHQKHNIGSSSAPGAGGGLLGGDSLMQLIKNYQHNSGFKRTLTVGVVGFPNVGKSSLINTLKRSKATAVGNTPGMTRNIQEVMLDNKIVLLDSPGVVLATSGHPADLILRNTIKIDRVSDVILPVNRITELTPMHVLCRIYAIPEYSTGEEFLHHIAHRKGKLKKGGIPDIDAAGKTILKDWNDGKIPFYVKPPEVVAEEAKLVTNDCSTEEVAFVSQLSAAFNLDDSFYSQEASAIQQLGFVGEGEENFVARAHPLNNLISEL
ncbi:hypothetical protein RCL1_006627 [Eukaryota sp. TZLM3-RCL]